ncbi:MAG: hypothetical protein ACUVWP_05500 [bacterium]
MTEKHYKNKGLIFILVVIICQVSYLYSWQSVEERLDSTIFIPTSDSLIEDILGEIEVDIDSFELSELMVENITNPKPVIFGDLGFEMGNNNFIKISGKEGISTKWLSEGFIASWDMIDKNGSPYYARNLNLQGDIDLNLNNWSSTGSQLNRYYYKRGTSSKTDLSKSGIIAVVNLSLTKSENLQLLVGSEFRKDRIDYKDNLTHTGITSKTVVSFIKPELNLFQIENNNYFDKSSDVGFYQRVIDTFITDTLNLGSKVSIMNGIGVQLSLKEKTDISLQNKLSINLGSGFGIFSEIHRRRQIINYNDLFIKRDYIMPSFPLQKPFIDLCLRNGCVYNISDGNSIETSFVYSKVSNFIYAEQSEDLPYSKNSLSVRELGIITAVEIHKNFTITNISFSIIKTRDKEGRRLPYEPTVRLNVNSTFTPTKQIEFLIGMKAESKRIENEEYKLGGLFIFDLGCKLKPIEDISIDFNIKDLFNKTHFSVYNQEDRGRTITGGVDVSIL